LIQADARSLPLIDGCVDCVVTSPPYWGMRDYGHPSQLGLQQTPDDYIRDLADVFDEVRRVLKPAGTAWVNLGDSFQNAKGQAGGIDPKQPARRHGLRPQDVPIDGLKPKDLVGIPWLFAFEARRRGWYLRQDVIWDKPNPTPDTAGDRPATTHEHVFLLAKSRMYWFDMDAIAQPYSDATIKRGKSIRQVTSDGEAVTRGGGAPLDQARIDRGKNAPSVWRLPASSYRGAHFATMPEKLVEPCILAGCPAGGLVLDPFVGSGTVVSVAQRLGRRGVGVDLGYQDLAKKRTAQRGFRFNEATA
jgi:DNA modification methylase